MEFPVTGWNASRKSIFEEVCLIVEKKKISFGLVDVEVF